MKICVIGNSHVGALKKAWDEISAEYEGLEFTFFAQRRGHLVNLEVKGDSLVPTNEDLRAALRHTSGGKDRITPADYDIFLVYGLRANANFRNDHQFISVQAAGRAMEDLTKITLSFRVVGQLRALTVKKIYLGHDPLEAARMVKSRVHPSQYIVGISDMNEFIYQPMNVQMIPQPVQTMVNGSETDPVFSQGSLRLEIGDELDGQAHPENETSHMNVEFGKIWLRDFLDIVKSGKAGVIAVEDRPKVKAKSKGEKPEPTRSDRGQRLAKKQPRRAAGNKAAPKKQGIRKKIRKMLSGIFSRSGSNGK